MIRFDLKDRKASLNMLPTVRSLAIVFVLGGGACLLSGCWEAPAQKPTGTGQRLGAERSLVAESQPDDAARPDGVELVDPLDSEEFATWLVADRRPAPGELV